MGNNCAIIIPQIEVSQRPAGNIFIGDKEAGG